MSCPRAGYARGRDCARRATQRRRDAEAARRVVEGLPDRGDETWVDVATARGRRPRSPSRAAKGRGKTKDATPTMGGTIDPVSDYDDTIDTSKEVLDRLGRVDVSYRGCPQQYLPEAGREPPPR